MSKNNKENFCPNEGVYNNRINLRPKLPLVHSLHNNQNIQNAAFKVEPVREGLNNRPQELFINLEQNNLQCLAHSKRSPTPISKPYEQHYSLMLSNNSPASSTSGSPYILSPGNNKTIFFYDLEKIDKDGYVVVDIDPKHLKLGTNAENSNKPYSIGEAPKTSVNGSNIDLVNIKCDCMNCTIRLGDCKLCNNEIHITDTNFTRSYCNDCATERFKVDETALLGE